MIAEEALRYARENEGRFVEDLKRLLRQPSISAQNVGVKECASLLSELMEESGIKVEILHLEDDYPVVFGKVQSRASARTLLIYSHYDVQPIDPLEEWKCDPFSADMEDGVIYARGASDAKNNIMATIKAVEYYLSEAEYNELAEILVKIGVKT